MKKSIALCCVVLCFGLSACKSLDNNVSFSEFSNCLESTAEAEASIPEKMNETTGDDLSESSEDSTPAGEIKIETYAMEALYDYMDPAASVSAHEYVFVGKIIENTGGEYPFGYVQTFENGEEMVINGNIYTRYSVLVEENIKGDLQLGQTRDVLKLGGYSEEKGIYYMCDGDVYPQLGREYIFLANERDAGLLVSSAPQTTVPLSADGNEISTYATDEKMDRQSLIDMYSEIVAEQGADTENNTENVELTESGTEPDAPEESNQGAAEPEEIQIETPVEVQPESPEEAQAGVTVEP